MGHKFEDATVKAVIPASRNLTNMQKCWRWISKKAHSTISALKKIWKLKKIYIANWALCKLCVNYVLRNGSPRILQKITTALVYDFIELWIGISIFKKIGHRWLTQIDIELRKKKIWRYRNCLAEIRMRIYKPSVYNY